MNTFELANSAFGPSSLEFFRLVSDNKAQFALPFSSYKLAHLLRFRLRVAGGDNLPIQKAEGLGGFDALRGFAFKQFPGQASILGTAEYDFGALFLFADVGSVMKDDRWMSPRAGFGCGATYFDFIRAQFAVPDDFSRFDFLVTFGHTF